MIFQLFADGFILEIFFYKFRKRNFLNVRKLLKRQNPRVVRRKDLVVIIGEYVVSKEEETINTFVS